MTLSKVTGIITASPRVSLTHIKRLRVQLSRLRNESSDLTDEPKSSRCSILFESATATRFRRSLYVVTASTALSVSFQSDERYDLPELTIPNSLSASMGTPHADDVASNELHMNTHVHLQRYMPHNALWLYIANKHLLLSILLLARICEVAFAAALAEHRIDLFTLFAIRFIFVEMC